MIPRLLVSAAVLCIGSAVALDYHQDQIAADNELAKKIRLPDAVAIQDFDPDRDINAINELHLLAEAQTERQVILNIGDENVARWVHVMPLFPVSQVAIPLMEAYASAHTQTPRRPMPRANAAELALSNIRLSEIESTPVAYSIRDIPEGSLAEFNLGAAGDHLGNGSTGKLVEIVGAQLSGASLSSQIKDALVPYGVNVPTDAIMVTPYEGRQESAFVVPDYSQLQATLLISGIAFSVLLLMSLLGFNLRNTVRPKPKRPEVVQAVGSFPSVDFFEPILSQEELAADQEAERTRSRIASRVA